MKWTELTVSTSREGIEPLTAALLELGVTGFIVENPEEIEAFIEENADKWDVVDERLVESIRAKTPNIKVYVSDNADGCALLANIKKAAARLKAAEGEKYGSLDISLCEMRDEDWENNWKAYFKPFTVGEKLAVCPTWERYDNPENRIVLMIDPASSFGSGLHESTRLCLRALEKYIKSEDRVLDIGCGSGILSVAAAKLGCAAVTAVDIDKNAVETALACARVNGEADKITVFQSDLISGVKEPCDLAVANLFASTVVRLSAEIGRVLGPSGLFVSSGIVDEGLQDVLNAYDQNGLEILEVMNDGQWYAVVGRK